MSYKLTLWISNVLSPIKKNSSHATQKIKNSFELVTDLANIKRETNKDVESIWQAHLKQHAISTLNIFQQKQFNRQWVKEHIHINQQDIFQSFCESKEGGVLLTYHANHQHQLCAVLGTQGLSINPLAVSPQSSPLYTTFKYYIDLLHHNASQHYNKGHYIFLEQGKNTLRTAYKALSNNQVIVSLNDNEASGANTEEVIFFGKKQMLSSGSIKMAKKYNKDIWASLLYWSEKDQYILEIKKLDKNKSTKDIMQDYINFLQDILLKKPEIWEGWQW